MATIPNNQLAAQYERDGYLFPLDVLSDEQLRRAQQALNDIESRAPPAAFDATVARALRINAQLLFPFVNEIARTTKLLNAVENILGPNLLIYSAEFFIKEPRTPKIVSWHQDLTYWGLGETNEELTAWVALSDVTVQSGCMRFVPGSHKQRIQPHRDTYGTDNLLSRGQEVAVEVDEVETINVELKPGQVSLHHGRIFHASGPNQSDQRRIGLAIRYVTPAVKQEVGDRDYAMIVRGIDNSGNWIHVAPPSVDFDPNNLPLYQQIREEQTRVLMRK